MRIVAFILLGLTFVFQSFGQSFQFTVNVNYDQLVAQQKTDPQAMTQLQTYATDFLNSYKFTDDDFKKEERIKCKLNINLVKSISLGSFEGNIQLVITRPVYRSGYETVLFTYIDKNVSFTYLPTTQLYFNENSYTEELPYLLAFYAYTAMIFDYDSFSKLGGSPYLQKAYNITNVARNSSPNKRGWDSSGDSRNRYWLIENLMSQQFIPFRESMYQYYRLGLDVATTDPKATRTQVLNTLTIINNVALQRPASVVVNSFFDAKSDEIFKILMEATPEEKAKAYTLLTGLDPSKTQLYQQLNQ